MAHGENGWRLHPDLMRDGAEVTDLPLCRLLVFRDATYPWLVLVPRRPRLVDVIDLDEDGRTQLMRETCAVAAALKAITTCDKLNVAALGNVVPQLHVHVIARFRNDAAWPNPVWGRNPPRPYEDAGLAAFVERLRGALASETFRQV